MQLTILTRGVFLGKLSERSSVSFCSTEAGVEEGSGFSCFLQVVFQAADSEGTIELFKSNQ